MRTRLPNFAELIHHRGSQGMDSQNPKHDQNQAAAPASQIAANSSPAGTPPTMSSAELLRGGRELRITHGGVTYRLLLTRTGKLLLQK